MNKWVVIIGIVILLIGLFWDTFTKIPLGKLPGDIRIEKENFRFYFPLGTSILISVILSVIFWLFKK